MPHEQNAAVDGITEDLALLTIAASDTSADSKSLTSMDSPEVEGIKRLRLNISGRLPGYQIGSSSFFDPLKYMRVVNSASHYDEVPEPISPKQGYIASLEEILEAGRQQTKLLVDTSSTKPRERTPKHKLSRNSHSTGSAHIQSAAVPKLPVAVFRFCQQHAVKYISLPLSRSYRSIAFRRSPDSGSPWVEYIRANVLEHYRICHSVMFKTVGSDGVEGRLVVIVPHSEDARVDEKFIESHCGLFSVTRMSLTSIEKELGFPTFVCPPFGHEFAPKTHALAPSEKKPFTTVIDSQLVVPGRRDCVFDLGVVALKLTPAELQRLALKLNWIVLDEVVRV